MSLEAFNDALVHAVHVRLGREPLDPKRLERGYQFFGGKKPPGHVYTQDEIFWGGSRNHDVNGNAGVAVGFSDSKAYDWWKPRVQKEQRLGSNQLLSPHYDPWTLAGAFAISYFGVWDKEDEAVEWSRKLLAYMVGTASAVQHAKRPAKGICHAAFGGEREHHHRDVFPNIPGPFFGASGGRSIFPVGGEGPKKHYPSAGRFFRGILEVYHLALGIKSNPPSNVYHADFPHALIEMMAGSRPDAHLFGITEAERKALRADDSNRVDPAVLERATSGFRLMGKDGREDAEYHVFRYKNGDVWTVFEDDVYGTKPGALATSCTDEVFECWGPSDFRSDKHDRRGSAHWDGGRKIVLEHPDPDEEWELRLPPESELVQRLRWKGQTGFVEQGGEFVPAPRPEPPVEQEPSDNTPPQGQEYASTPYYLAGAAVLDGWYSPRGDGKPPKRVANAGAWGVSEDLRLDKAGSPEWLLSLYSELVDGAGGNFALSLYDPRFPKTLENVCKVWRDHFVGRLWVAPYLDPGSLLDDPTPLSAGNLAKAVKTWYRTFRRFLDSRMWAGIDGRKVVALWLPNELAGSTSDVLSRASELVFKEIGFDIHWSDAGHNADKDPHSINGLFYTASSYGVVDVESGWTMAQPGFWEAMGDRYLVRSVDRFRRVLATNPAARVRIVPFNEWTEGSQVVEPAVLERTVDDVFGSERQWEEPHSVTSRNASWGGDPRVYLEQMRAVFSEHLAQNGDEEPTFDPPAEVDRSDWIDPSTLPAPVDELVELYIAVTQALEA